MSSQHFPMFFPWFTIIRKSPTFGLSTTPAPGRAPALASAIPAHFWSPKDMYGIYIYILIYSIIDDDDDHHHHHRHRHRHHRHHHHHHHLHHHHHHDCHLGLWFMIVIPQMQWLIRVHIYVCVCVHNIDGCDNWHHKYQTPIVVMIG